MDTERKVNVLTQGLSSEQVKQRHEAGQSNHVERTTSRPVKEILRANIFTTFNAVLTVAVIAVLAVGDWRDAVFGLVMVLNSAIGFFSELRSKRTLDSVAVLDSPTSQVYRDGRLVSVLSEDLVCDDLVLLRLGDQIPADGQTVASSGAEIDESILTGESLPVRKQPGDLLLSGTAVVAGSATMLVEKIGADAWARKITAQAKQFSLATSEIQQSINRILGWITWALPFVVALLIWSQLKAYDNDWKAAIVFAVAGVVGMIPQGLVLLTSMNFGIAAATLARKSVLVQELPAVEILARVDCLCLDKTGTLTTGGIRGKELLSFIPEPGSDQTDNNQTSEPHPSWPECRQVFRWLTDDDTNATAEAIGSLLDGEEADNNRQTQNSGRIDPESTDRHNDGTLSTRLGTLADYTLVPFSSARKWSALIGSTQPGNSPGQQGTWVMGAPEIVFAKSQDSSALAQARESVQSASSVGNRSVCLAFSIHISDQKEELPTNLQPMGLAILEEDIRSDAKETLEFFRRQGVQVRVISGDAPATVAAIAKEVGLQSAEGLEDLEVIDARTLPEMDTPEFDAVVAKADVYGRVNPDQKRGLVRSMQRQGKTVAMTGDGVNDALALKEADLGIAMGNGAPATKAVSRIVLMKGEFSVLPGVVAEGRKIIANMERVSSLFLAKTTYALLMAVIVSLAAWSYPFLPRQLTYIGWFAIGTPAFFLALAPNNQRYRPGFLNRTLLVAVPSGIIMGLFSLLAYYLIGQGTASGQTAATLTMIMSAIWLLGITARPWVSWRVFLLLAMAIGAILGVIIVPIRNFFALQWPDPQQWMIIAGTGIVACILVEITYRATSRYRNRSHPLPKKK